MERPDLSSQLLAHLSSNSNFTLEKHMKIFRSLKTHLQRLNFVYEDLQKYNLFLKLQKNEKNDEMSTAKREIGNKHFREGKYREALDCYTTSILTAKSKAVLSLAYANRSAALSKLNLHNECLVDIDRAFENGYPDNLKPKLIKRQENSKLAKKRENKSFEEVPQFPDSEKNDAIPNARNCIKIVTNEQFGRHVVACRNIEIGEVLVVEKPLAGVIQHQIYVYCHHCFKLCYNLIPCDVCIEALYCSDNCKVEAVHSYHKFECPILSTFRNRFVDTLPMALIIAFLGKKLDLETHFERRADLDVFRTAVTAAAVFKLVKDHTTFLNSGINENDVKELILKSLLFSGINGTYIREFYPEKIGLNLFNPIAGAMHPTFTFFNHSCWPNVIYQHHGATIVMRAINSIKKGEQCFVSYGPEFWVQNKEQRQTFLAKYHFFKCQCQACEQNWSLEPGRLSHFEIMAARTVMEEFSQLDVDVAKKRLPLLLKEAEKREKTAPPGQDIQIKSLLIQCFQMFGNKRQI